MVINFAHSLKCCVNLQSQKSFPFWLWCSAVHQCGPSGCAVGQTSLVRPLWAPSPCLGCPADSHGVTSSSLVVTGAFCRECCYLSVCAGGRERSWYLTAHPYAGEVWVVWVVVEMRSWPQVVSLWGVTFRKCWMQPYSCLEGDRSYQSLDFIHSRVLPVCLFIMSTAGFL